MSASSCLTLADDLELLWQQLPPLPDPIGFAGAYAGTSGGALIVAGGANFPGRLPWEGGSKIWHDQVFVLESPSGPWKNGAKLPMPCGYGVSVTAPNGVICVGGSDAEKHLTNVFLLTWNGKQQSVTNMPSLPVPIANSCGALVGSALYIAGGTDSPDATNALRRFFCLQIDDLARGWRELPPWPGPGRMLAAAAAVGDSFFLAGGTGLHGGVDGKPVRTYLRDAYRFTPSHGWRKITDLPNPVVAAPSPAPATDDHSFLLVGGDDGSLTNFEPRSKHPGFPKRVWRYDIDADHWSALDDAPVSRATLPSANWRGLWVMPSGEAKPGIRSPQVWALRAGDKKRP